METNRNEHLVETVLDMALERIAGIHSRYWRRLCDLAVADRSVDVRLRVRRFWCDGPTCPKRTFAERLPDLAPFGLGARRA